MEVYAAHQQIITKADKFYGYDAGALSLCVAVVCLNELFVYLLFLTVIYYTQVRASLQVVANR